MAYTSIGKGKVRDWIWAGAVFAIMAAGVLWFVWSFDTFEGQTPAQPAAPAEQTVSSDEWTAAPKGEHVDVVLPETPIKNVPQNEPAKETQDPDTR